MNDRAVSDTEATPLSAAGILESADQDHANRIMTAVHEAAQGANMATLWWSIAQLQAGVLAAAPPELQLWLAGRLAELCEVALPAALVATARARGEDLQLPRLN